MKRISKTEIKEMRSQSKKNRIMFAFTLPTVILYTIFFLVTMLIGVYYRNLLGGLYRENPVKSRNYEAVKSSKKWENVGNSYIIPALLLYSYSYI